MSSSSSSLSSLSDEDGAGDEQQSPRAALDMPAQPLEQQVAEQPDGGGFEQQAGLDMPALEVEPDQEQAAEQPVVIQEQPDQQPEQPPFDAEAGGDASAPTIYSEDEQGDRLRPYMENLIDLELRDFGFSQRQREAAGDGGLNVVAEGAGPGGAAAPLNLTPNDELAIARLVALGYNVSVATQAYISAARIEELARNFLMNAEESDDDMELEVD